MIDGTPDTVVRLDHRPLGFTAPVLWIERGVLGWVADVLGELGFESLRTRDPNVPLPTSADVGVDMRLADTLHLLIRRPIGDPQVFFTASFPDVGEPYWTDTAHVEQRIIVFVSSKRPDRYEHTRAFLLDSDVVICGLVLYAFTAGVGTRAQIG